MKKQAIVVLVFSAFLAGSGGLTANEEGLTFNQFCREDTRYKAHLVAGGVKQFRRNRVINYQVTLIRLVGKCDSSLSLHKGSKGSPHSAALSVDPDSFGGFKLGLKIDVSPNGSFSNVFFSTLRESIIARKFACLIRAGDVTPATEYKRFAEIYRRIHQEATSSLKGDLESFLSDWIVAEGIIADTNSWKEAALAEISKEGDEMPSGVKKRAELLFASYHSWVESN